MGHTEPDSEEGEQTERRREARRQGLAYQGAFEAVIAIVIAALIGYWVDERWQTSPWGVLLGTAVGFGSFVLRLVRLGRQLNDARDGKGEDGSERR